MNEKTIEQADLDMLRHSTAHLMAAAVVNLFPETKVAIGPSIEDGFYYDFDRPQPFVPEDLEKIEAKMKEIAKGNLPFLRSEKTKEEALAFFKERNEKYKVELIEAIPDDKVTFYQTGDFIDLCRGPHVKYSSKLKHFKLLSIAGAYWRGDEKREQLQRIYGTVFPTKEELEAHLNRLEEAKKRDHRKLGRELDLFSINEEVGPGLVLWHPKGARIRMIIEDFWRKKHIENGYEMVFTPHIGLGNLWETSGHLDFYKEFMYSPMKIDENNYYAKPMNCPFHLMIYKSALYSYRDLPLRWAELGTVYRYEKSGVLHGLMRVRGFTQDDAHIICRPDQMPDEIRKVIRFCLNILNAFGFKEFNIYVATKPKEKSVGDPVLWEDATKALQEAVKAENLTCSIDEGGGAFYGPKIDIKVKDALNREWQCSTIQFDFNEPERFDLTYIDQSGKKVRPYMIHRALMGSLERFFGVLVEHYGGAFPVFLAPVQVQIMNITEKQEEYGLKLLERFTKTGIRADFDLRNEKIGFKIREAALAKVPYMAVIGDKEKEGETIAVRTKEGKDLGSMKPGDFINLINEEVSKFWNA
ncbi:MAG: threonine--tRNA ligase [Elusimicrobia bacterium]|nr:threonine--tRNA ligase [Candidatus Liberimonas magnetica]